MSNTKQKSGKKTRVYECAYFEYDCDDLGKYCFCHNLDIPGHECTVTGRGIYCQKGCTGYKKGKLRGAWVISDWEKKELRELKMKLKKESAEREACERALYEHLKKKYG